MPGPIHTDDNHSPRSELLSPTSGSSASPPAHFHQVVSSIDSNSHPHSRPHFRPQSQSSSHSHSPPTPPKESHRERRHNGNRRQSDRRTNGYHNHHHTTELNGQSSNPNHTNNNNNRTSPKSAWRLREQELNQSSITKQELIRMIISAERETSKLHSTLTNTLTLLETESHKSAALERDSLSTFTHLKSLCETAETLAEKTAQDCRVAQFSLEHKEREVERLKKELETEKDAREDIEREVERVKNVAWKIRRERIMDKAREEGRREGFEKGFMKAQAENAARIQMRAEVAAQANMYPSIGTVANAVAGPSAPPGLGSGLGAWPQGRRPSGPSATERAPKIEPSQAPTQNDPGPDEEVDSDESYVELDSVPMVTPPGDIHAYASDFKVPMKTGHSPVRRPVPLRNADAVPERGLTPSVHHYPVSIPPQSVIEETINVGKPPRNDWVTGAEHSAFHGPTPPGPPPLVINTSVPRDGHGAQSQSATRASGHVTTPQSANPSRKKGVVKFARPNVASFTSWYRSLSFRKKPKQKVLIDPEMEEGQNDVSAPVTPADEIGGLNSTSGHGHSVHGHHPPSTRTQRSTGLVPNVVNVRQPPGSQRHSRPASVSASMTSAARPRENNGYPPVPRVRTSMGHKPRAGSVDSMSTHISTSQFDLLNTPGNAAGTGGGSSYSRGGQANASVGSLNSLGNGGGKPQSISGKSARSQGAGGIGKKLSMIRENPMSRDTTPVRIIREGADQGGHEPPLLPPVRPFVQMEGDRRSMKSAKSTSSRMVAVNPDPDSSPDWPAGAPVPGSSSARQEVHITRPMAPPPEQSALLGSDSGIGRPAGVNLPVIAPLRTKKSGLSSASGGSGITMNTTPTPMSRDKGKGKEKVHPGIIGETPSGGEYDTSPGIGIAVQTPSDGARNSSRPPHQPQDAEFLSPRQSSSRSLPQSRHGGTSVATSTTKVQEDPPMVIPTAGQQTFKRSTSPIPRSTPKIFLKRGSIGSTESVIPFEEAKRPNFTVVHRVEIDAGGPGIAGNDGRRGGDKWTTKNAGMTPGPAILQPLPSRMREQGAPEMFLQADRGLYRTGSSGSLRSQGSYGKFDSSTYVDPAFWGAETRVQEGGGYGRPVSRQSFESKRISYADP